MEKRDVDAGILELMRLVPSHMSAIVEKTCRENLRLNSQPERSAYKVNAQAHSYGPNNTKICDGLFGSLVFAEMCKDGRCSAPTFSHAPIFTGKVEKLVPFDDLIVKLVDQQARAIYNVTLPTHIFFPGYVKLVVIENETMTVVAVSGKGNGNWMSLNTKFGPLLFETILRKHLVPKVAQRKPGGGTFLSGGGGNFGGGGASGRW